MVQAEVPDAGKGMEKDEAGKTEMDMTTQCPISSVSNTKFPSNLHINEQNKSQTMQATEPITPERFTLANNYRTPIASTNNMQQQKHMTELHRRAYSQIRKTNISAQYPSHNEIKKSFRNSHNQRKLDGSAWKGSHE